MKQEKRRVAERVGQRPAWGSERGCAGAALRAAPAVQNICTCRASCAGGWRGSFSSERWKFTVKPKTGEPVLQPAQPPGARGAGSSCLN